MEDPVGFTRPPGWPELPDGDEPDAPAPPPPAAEPVPAVAPPAAEPVRPVAPPAAEPPAAPALAGIARWTGRPPRRPGTGTWLALAGLLVLLVLLPLVAAVTAVLDPPRPQSTWTPEPVPEPAPTRWTVDPSGLRSDLAKPAFVTDVAGDFYGPSVIDAGSTWLVLTGTEDDEQVVVHGLDPDSGSERWHRPLASALCAARPLSAGVVCAAAVATDPASGLGTRWRLAVLDPATGAEVRATTFEGWLTLVYVRGNRIMLVEQRQPAPHAVVTVLGADLAQRARVDLAEQPNQDRLFSDNRVYSRKFGIPDGPALDRPRIREVGDGLTTLWAGTATAFLDLRAGRLVGMPVCSRLVDDGERLWCNDGDQAVAYSYRLKRLSETSTHVRLAFPDHDPDGGDVTDPVFIAPNATVLRVDLATGRTLGELVALSNRTAFGMVVPPSACFVKGLSLVSDGDRTFAIDPRSGAVLWRSDDYGSTQCGLAWGDSVVLDGSVLRVIDPATGAERASYRSATLGVERVGSSLVGTGFTGLARLDLPR